MSNDVKDYQQHLLQAIQSFSGFASLMESIRDNHFFSTTEAGLTNACFISTIINPRRIFQRFRSRSRPQDEEHRTTSVQEKDNYY